MTFSNPTSATVAVSVSSAEESPETGLRAHLAQFSLLVVLNLFVGGMVGLERSVLPVLAQDSFGMASHAAAISFIVTFGLTKAAMNLAAGILSDRFGRRACLLAGWLVGIPVPLIIIFAPDWSWVLVANVLLGVNQALTWSMTVNMKIDIAGPRQRGLAIGLNEFAGYMGVAVVAFLTGLIASEYGMRPAPFYLGIGIAFVGLGMALFTRNTSAARVVTTTASPRNYEIGTKTPAAAGAGSGTVGFREVLRRGTWADARLSAASLSGLVTNLKDGMLWGLLPLFLTGRGLGLAEIGVVAGVYPAVWGVAQLIFGPLSDRISRSSLIAAGMAVQGLGVLVFALVHSYSGYLLAAVLVGTGTAMVYPTLQAFVSDVVPASSRASALGVYRFWRDLGYALGALGAGVIADTLGIESALVLFTALAAVSVVVMLVRGRQRGDHISIALTGS